MTNFDKRENDVAVEADLLDSAGLRDTSEAERQDVRGGGPEFGSLLSIKRIPAKGATHVAMQGCTCGEASSE